MQYGYQCNTGHEKEKRSGRQAKKDGELSILVGTVEQWEQLSTFAKWDPVAFLHPPPPLFHKRGMHC